MKRIFCFLLVLGVAFSFVGQVSAQGTCKTVDGQVRYGFEMKKLTANEAQQAVKDGYVDLYAYACFDEAFVKEGLISLNNAGKIIRWALLAADATHSYKIVDKDGNDDKTGSIAMFAAPNSNACNGRPAIYQPSSGGACPKTFIQSCPTWAYGSSSSRSSLLELEVLTDLYCTTIKAEGKTWYCLRLYPVRFEYKQPQSFYVTFYRGDAADGVTSNGASNFNFYAENTSTQLLWPGKACGAGQDWSQSNYWGTIRGGVEIETNPEMQLSADKVCGVSGLSGRLDVKAWNGKTWADYGKVTAYTVDASGNRHDVTSQVSFAPGQQVFDASGAVTATGAQSGYAFTLPASAYMVDGKPAKSLMWAIGDTFPA